MHTLLRLALCFVVIIGGVHGLSCPCLHNQDFSCEELEEDDCPFGLTSDACGCCSICTKGPGEMCGGHFMGFVACSDGYSCRADPDDLLDEGYNTLHYCIKNSGGNNQWKDFPDYPVIHTYY